MKPTTDLLECDLVFTQQGPLTPEEFLQQCNRRGLRSPDLWSQLEALHRAKAFFPMYRFEKNVELIVEAYRQPDPPSLMIEVALGTLNTLSAFLAGEKQIGHLYNPRSERFRPWRKFDRKFRAGTVRTSEFLYSPYQLLLVPQLRFLFRKLGRRHRMYMRLRKWLKRPLKDLNYSLKLRTHKRSRARVLKDIKENDELIIILTALEAKYRPKATGRLTGCSLKEWAQYDRQAGPVEILNWLGWDAERVLKTAEFLLTTANSIDPLEGWNELVRLIRFDKWNELSGDALLAMDHRIAAEILLLFYEDLVEADAAPPLKPLPLWGFAPRHTRLRTDRSEIDAVLTSFGISPHPSVVLVLEGGTEVLMVRRVMELMSVPLRRSYIELFIIGGVKKNLALLASYIVTPQLGQPVGEGWMLERPPTHLFLVLDPDRPLQGAAERAAERKTWVDQIYKGLPAENRTDSMRRDIDWLVRFETWDDQAQTFEFANFTDEEIADAILKVYQGTSKIPRERLIAQVHAERANPKRKNIEKLWGPWNEPWPDKISVAEALWPTLEIKIRDAVSRCWSRRARPLTALSPR